MSNLDNIIFISTPTPAPMSFAQQQATLLAALEPQRLVRQNAGLSYPFVAAVPAVMAPDGVTVITPAVPAVVGTIQTRDQTQYPDILNITGETIAASILVGQGETNYLIYFRDQENVTHPMTPPQVLAMGMAVSSFISTTYAAKWIIQAQINALTPQTIDSFDITQGWPA